MHVFAARHWNHAKGVWFTCERLRGYYQLSLLIYCMKNIPCCIWRDYWTASPATCLLDPSSWNKDMTGLKLLESRSNRRSWKQLSCVQLTIGRSWLRWEVTQMIADFKDESAAPIEVGNKCREGLRNKIVICNHHLDLDAHPDQLVNVANGALYLLLVDKTIIIG